MSKSNKTSKKYRIEYVDHNDNFKRREKIFDTLLDVCEFEEDNDYYVIQMNRIESHGP